MRREGRMVGSVTDAISALNFATWIAQMPDNIRTSSPSAPQKGIFFKEAEYWTVGLGGKTVRLKDSKGLAYLSYLLRHPAMEFHVLDLVGGIASGSDGDEVDRLAADSMRLCVIESVESSHPGRARVPGTHRPRQAGLDAPSCRSITRYASSPTRMSCGL